MRLQDVRSVVNELYRAKIEKLKEERETATQSQIPNIDKKLGYYKSLYAGSLIKSLAWL